MTDASATTEAPRVLVMLSGGGFTFETKTLLGRLHHNLRFCYLRTPFGGVPGEDGIPDGPDQVVPMFATVTQASLRQNIRAFVSTFLATRALVKGGDVAAILGVGCSHLVPMFLAGRLAGCRTIFVETITRSDRPSATGRLIYHLRLADLFIVQWPALKRQLPRSAEGTIL